MPAGGRRAGGRRRRAVNLWRWRARARARRCSYSSILFNLPRYREMHSITISPGVEDSAHLRILSSLAAPRRSRSPRFALSFQRVAEEGVGVLEGSCIQLITPPGLITSRPGSRPTYNPPPSPSLSRWRPSLSDPPPPRLLLLSCFSNVA